MTYTALLSTVYYAAKTLVDPTILPNAGLARLLHVTAPEGTVVSCASRGGEWPAWHVPTRRRPDPRCIGGGGAGAGDRGNQRRLHIDHVCRHQPHDNSLWVYLETTGGGSGARGRRRMGSMACTCI